jgi:drug/metabolite transporter (DMT)-like permease
MTSPSSLTRDYLHLHFIVLIWGFTAILGLLITIPSVELVFYRTLIAFLTLGGLMLLMGKSVRLESGAFWKIFGTGFIIAGHWILFFWAARVSNASVCLAGMATTSLWTSLLEPWINKRKISKFEVFLGLLVLVGLYVIFRFEFSYALGLTMALGSAFLGALFTVFNGQFTRHHEPYTITLYEMLGACLGTVLFFPIYTLFLSDSPLQMHMEGLDWLWIGLLATVCTVYAFSASVEIMKRISAFAVNLTVNLEPVYGIILAVLIFGEKEKMQGGFYLGTSIILLAVLAYPVGNRIMRKRQPQPDLLH